MDNGLWLQIHAAPSLFKKKKKVPWYSSFTQKYVPEKETSRDLDLP
jgi:hypothetical protein